MKKFLLSFFTILIFAFYVVFTRNSEYAVVSMSATGGGGGQAPELYSRPPLGETPPLAARPAAPPRPAARPPTVKKYKDGTWRGDVADAYYGSLEVAAIVKNGRISDVQFLQYPSAGGHTSEVSDYSLPILKQEAIEAQSANVDIVSGATQTSGAFRESLAAALGRAKT